MGDRPNILVVLSDQQRWDTVGAYGNPMDVTPSLNGMADRGTRFERAFTPQPVCGPARACLQTGQYGTESGVPTNGIPLPDDVPLLADQFTAAGYTTGYIGKWHLANTGSEPVPEELRGGYDHWRAADTLEHSSHPYEGVVYDEKGDTVEFEGYRVDHLTEMAREFIRTDRERPFFCFLSYLEPHHQNDMGTYTAPEGYDWKYRNPWVPEDLAGHPGDWVEELPDYYGCCRRIDECLSDLLTELDLQEIRDDTVVVFTSDHGCHFRTRNREYKRSAHESSIRVPFVVEGPGFEDNEISELVSLLDLPPTLLNVAEIDVPETMQGRSVTPLLDEGDREWKEEVFIQLNTAELGRAIRTDRWKYAVYDPDRDERQTQSEEYTERYLYDLRVDPHEQVNLIGRMDYREIADELRDRLREKIEAAEGEQPTITAAEYHA